MEKHELDAEELEDEAIRGIRLLLRPLEKPAQERVVRHLIERYGLEVGRTSDERPRSNNSVERSDSKARARNDSDVDPTALLRSFSTAAELFTATGPPATGPERVLVIAAHQQIQSDDDSPIRAQSVQEQLKHLGYQVANITDSMSALIARRPQLVVQTGKSGRSRQARKEYKVTLEGYRAVARMTRATAQEETT